MLTVGSAVCTVVRMVLYVLIVTKGCTSVEKYGVRSIQQWKGLQLFVRDPKSPTETDM